MKASNRHPTSGPHEFYIGGMKTHPLQSEGSLVSHHVHGKEGREEGHWPLPAYKPPGSANSQEIDTEKNYLYFPEFTYAQHVKSDENIKQRAPSAWMSEPGS